MSILYYNMEILKIYLFICKPLYALVSFVDHQIGRVLDALETDGLVDNTRIIYSSDHGDNVGDRGLWGKSTMYEESAAIPMMMAGPDIPMQKAVKTLVSLVDIYATAIECLGHELNEADKALPSRSLFGFLKQEAPERTILSEYHAMGSRHASFMLRYKDWKYIYYVNKEPELFNLADDPDESHNLVGDPDQAELLRQFEAMLRSYCDPEAVDKLAHSEQRKRLDELGGVEKILADGAPLYSPVPGEKSSDQIEAQEQLRQS